MNTKEKYELIEKLVLSKDDHLLLQIKNKDDSTHVSNVPHHFHLGGENDHFVFISNPKTGKIIQRHIIDEFSDWLILMTETLKRLRTSAINYAQT